MKPSEFITIMDLAERLKNNTRHSWTSSGRRESVAEHSWRLMLMAYFVKDEFPEADIDKVLRMCMVHDMGEAFTGDIPAFEKTREDEAREADQVGRWLKSLAEPYRTELGTLFDEMERQETTEARIYKALDKLEALIQHNEAPLATWLPLEYELQLNYGVEAAEFSDYMRQLREEVKLDSVKKTTLPAEQAAEAVVSDDAVTSDEAH